MVGEEDLDEDGYFMDDERKEELYCQLEQLGVEVAIQRRQRMTTATKLQAMQRGHRVRKERAKAARDAQEKAAVTKMQALRRGKDVRREQAADAHAAVRLQTLFRGTSVRKHVDARKQRTKAASRIQALNRGRTARKQVVASRQAELDARTKQAQLDEARVKAKEAAVARLRALDEKVAAAVAVADSEAAEVAAAEAATSATVGDSAAAALQQYRTSSGARRKRVKTVVAGQQAAAASKIQAIRRGQAVRREHAANTEAVVRLQTMLRGKQGRERAVRQKQAIQEHAENTEANWVAEALKWKQQAAELTDLIAKTLESNRAETAWLQEANRQKNASIVQSQREIAVSHAKVVNTKGMSQSARRDAVHAIRIANGTADAAGCSSAARLVGGQRGAADDVERLFSYFDADGSGSLDLQEFKLATLLAIDDEELVVDVFERLDSDGAGELSLQDFKSGFAYLKSQVKQARYGMKKRRGRRRKPNASREVVGAPEGDHETTTT